MQESKPQTILVADDEPALLRLMHFVLEKQGYIMLTAANGEEALTKIREAHPDLVVLDIMMPRMDGYQVAEAIRADPVLSHTPILMLSAKAQAEDIAHGAEVGADSFITKPFAPDALVQIVAELLAGSTKK